MLSAPSPLFFSFHLSSYILLPCRPSRLPRLFLPVVTVRQSESVCQKICLCGLRISCIYIFDIFHIIFFLNVNFVLKNMCRFAGLTLSTHTVSLQPPKSKTKCFWPDSRTLNRLSYSRRSGVLWASCLTKTNLEVSKVFGSKVSGRQWNVRRIHLKEWGVGSLRQEFPGNTEGLTKNQFSQGSTKILFNRSPSKKHRRQSTQCHLLEKHGAQP